jgi:hypothetical protein
MLAVITSRTHARPRAAATIESGVEAVVAVDNVEVAGLAEPGHTQMHARTWLMPARKACGVGLGALSSGDHRSDMIPWCHCG